MTSDEFGQLIDDFELGADVMPGESLTDYIERRRREFESKAEGGSIGIEVLFGPKREDFNIGGQAKKTNKTPYDSRASIMDYAAALDKVGAGTQAEKSKSLGQYAKNFFTGLGDVGLKQLNPAVRGIASFYGAGKPISKFDDFGRGTQQAIQGAILRTLKDPNAKFSKTNIPVSSYQSYFKDKPTAQKLGVGVEGYDTFGAQAKDMAKALAGNQEAIARMTLGRFNLDIDPEARTASLRDTYNFANKMPFGGGKEYGINMALPQSFVDEILKTPEYQKLLGPQFPDYKTAALQSQFYKNNPSSLDFDLFKAAYAKATGGPQTTIGSDGAILTNYGNYDPSRTYSSYMSNTQTSGNRPFFDQFVKDKTFNKSALLSMYGAPGYMKPYYADGGRVGMVSGGALKSIGSGIMKLFSKGDDAVDLAKQEEIFRSGNITTDFLENVDDKVIEKFIRTRDTKGVGGYGMYKSFDDMPNGLKAAELISRIKTADGGINYEAAELFIGKKLKGDETVDELISMVITEKKADGGRIGFKGGGADMGASEKAQERADRGYGSTAGVDRSAVSEGSQYARNVAAQNDSPGFKQKVKSVITNPATQALGGTILTGGISLAIPDVLNKLNKARMIKNAIDYARYVAPDEAIEGELENIQTKGGISPYADGGRVGFFMGGPALEGQALSIYNSMNAYGFDDQAIANALEEQGLYTPSGSNTPTVPEITAPNIIGSQLNQGGGDNNFGGQGIGAFGNLDPNTKQTMQVEVADGKGGVEIKEVDTYLDAGGMRKTLDNKNPVNAGIDVKPLAVGIFESIFGKKTDDEFDSAGKIYGTFNNPNYKDLSFFGKIKADYSRQKELKQLQKEFELQEQLKKQIAEEQKQAAATQVAFEKAMDQGRSFYDQFGKGDAASSATREQAGAGYSRSDDSFTSSPFAKGGLATMFTRRR